MQRAGKPSQQTIAGAPSSLTAAAMERKWGTSRGPIRGFALVNPNACGGDGVWRAADTREKRGRSCRGLRAVASAVQSLCRRTADSMGPEETIVTLRLTPEGLRAACALAVPPQRRAQHAPPPALFTAVQPS